MNDDWRLTNQMEYLFGVKLKHINFEPLNEKWEHEHCSFCFDKFSKSIEGSLTCGYCTLNEYYWICEKCYNDFINEFSWEIIN